MNRGDLERLLCENIPELLDERIWIWGIGNTSQLYQQGFGRLEKEGFTFEGYIDRTVSNTRRIFNGKQVIVPEDLPATENICVLICTIRPETVKEIKECCNKLQLENFLVDEVILKQHRSEVLECYDMLYDQRSKDVYAELVRCRLTGQNPNVGVKDGDCYFCLDKFVWENPNEVFVDCGAYIGDTIEEYLKQKNGKFKKIIAFEPDEYNFARLKEQVDKECDKWNLLKEQFELYPYGIGERCSIGGFERYGENDGLGSKIVSSFSEEEGGVRIVSLDDFLTEPYSFLKADIESYEYQMLLGAQNGIKKYKPLLAICIYHNSVDFYTIPLLIKSILPEYKIAVRHHLDDLSETVVYAWI